MQKAPVLLGASEDGFRRASSYKHVLVNENSPDQNQRSFGYPAYLKTPRSFNYSEYCRYIREKNDASFAR